MTGRSHTAYIGVGANLGDPIQQIVDARVALLALPSTASVRSASLFSSSPIGYNNQPDFINTVFEVVTAVPAHELFTLMQEIEIRLGRQRDLNNQNAPRMIDLDLLCFDDQEINDELLIVPHPRMRERLFVLKPLLELAPSLVTQSLSAEQYRDQRLYKLVV